MTANLPTELARQIVTGRQLAQRHQRAPIEETLPTACPELDRLLAGGLARGSMVELVGRRSSGRFSLVTAVLAAATSCGEAAALIDLGDAFDPQGAEAAGVTLDLMLWARPRTTREALACAEAILASGIPLLVLDLGLPPIPGGRGVEASWLRLARRARAQRVALLIASPYRVSGTAAQEVVEAQSARPRWSGTGTAPRLLSGLESRLALRKSRARAGRESRFVETVGLRTAEELLERPHQDTVTGSVTVPAPVHVPGAITLPETSRSKTSLPKTSRITPALEPHGASPAQRAIA